MHTHKAFTLVELLATLLLIALLVVVLLPALSSTRTRAQQKQNETQVREIHQAMNLFANRRTIGTSECPFPGLDWPADPHHQSATSTNTTTITVPGNPDGAHPAVRYAFMLDKNMFSGTITVAPADDGKHVWAAGQPFSTRNYSYAMLDIRFADSRKAHARIDEWHETLSSGAVVLADRNTGGPEDKPNQWASIWSNDAWTGAICWNDNNVVTLHDQTEVQTRYGNDHLHSVNDQLFYDGPGAGVCRLVYSNSSSGADQH